MPLPDSIVEAGARALFLAADTGGDPKVRPNSAEDWDSLLAEVRAGTLPEDELDSYYRQARICFAAMLRACAEEEAAHATSYERAYLRVLAAVAEDAE